MGLVDAMRLQYRTRLWEGPETMWSEWEEESTKNGVLTLSYSAPRDFQIQIRPVVFEPGFYQSTDNVLQVRYFQTEAELDLLGPHWMAVNVTKKEVDDGIFQQISGS